MQTKACIQRKSKSQFSTKQKWHLIFVIVLMLGSGPQTKWWLEESGRFLISWYCRILINNKHKWKKVSSKMCFLMLFLANTSVIAFWLVSWYMLGTEKLPFYRFEATSRTEWVMKHSNSKQQSRLQSQSLSGGWQHW